MTFHQRRFPSPRPRAFTLVELLVVIGIIALLISILLPALNRARQAANNVACLSNLRQIGIAIEMYANQHNGTLPYGAWRTTGPFPAPGDRQGGWGTLLMMMMGRSDGTWTSEIHGQAMRGVFLDRDTVPQPGDLPMIQHYSAHPVLMPEIHLDWPAGHPLAGQRRTPYRKSQIRRASETTLIMDGTQFLNGPPEFWGIAGDSHPVTYFLDSRRITTPAAPRTFLLEDLLPQDEWNRSINGGLNVDANREVPDDPRQAPANIRWRHLNNSSANFLFVDGHAASRRYYSVFETEVLRRNIHVPMR